VLVHAVGSGVGTAALQIARALGCFTTGTSRTADKLDRAQKLGLDAAILVSSDTSLRDALAREGRAHDVVLDLVGGPYVAQSIDSVAERGRIVVVGLTGGARTELDLGALLRKRLSVVGTVLRSRPLEEKIEAAQLLERTIVPWVLRGLVRPVIDAVLPLAQAAEAHRRLAANATFGKVLLDLRPSPS
jgi:NADPH2:quinone reductase